MPFKSRMKVIQTSPQYILSQPILMICRRREREENMCRWMRTSIFYVEYRNELFCHWFPAYFPGLDELCCVRSLCAMNDEEILPAAIKMCIIVLPMLLLSSLLMRKVICVGDSRVEEKNDWMRSSLRSSVSDHPCHYVALKWKMSDVARAEKPVHKCVSKNIDSLLHPIWHGDD